MKFLLLIFAFLLTNFQFNQDISNIYEVYKIIDIDKDDFIFFIRNEQDMALIVRDNNSLVIDSSFQKIEIGKKYLFVLTERKFRGRETSGYAIIDSLGKNHKIWDVSKDGKMPDICIAKNVKSCYIQPTYK